MKVEIIRHVENTPRSAGNKPRMTSGFSLLAAWGQFFLVLALLAFVLLRGSDRS